MTELEVDRDDGVRERRRRRLKPVRLVTGFSILFVLLLGALVIPLLSNFGAEEIIASNALAGPSLAHPFGCDDLGRDVLVRVMEGYRISLVVSVGATLIAVMVGLPLGMLSGYFSGLVDNLIMRPLDVLMSFPAILLAVLVIAIAGTGTVVLVFAIGFVYAPVIARVSRSTTVAVRSAPFVEATRARGASHTRILVRHILPNSVGPVIVQASLLLGFAILLESAFSFVGLGVRPPTPSLGLMLASGRGFMLQAPWVVIAPGAAIMAAVLAFNLIGDGFRDALDPRRRARLR